MFSKACEYGIRACIFIAEQSLLNRKVGLKEVARSVDTPEAYTSKILQLLNQHQIILSEKGPHGGFSMSPSTIENLKLSRLVSVIDGDDIYKGCGLGLKRCNEKKPCPVHFQFKLIREDLKHMLENTTIKSLTLDVTEGLSFLKR